MKKKLKKQLNKLLPEGWKVKKDSEIILKEVSNDLFVGIGFYVESEPTKEQLLEKAERDYPKWTVVIDAYDKNRETTTGEYYWRDEWIWDNSENCCLYKKGKWAEIIDPVIKVQNKHLYENDEYWELYKDNYILKKQVAQKGVSEYYETKDFERFLTKEAALDCVLVELKSMFKGNRFAKLRNWNNKHYVKECDIIITDSKKYIEDDSYTLWNEKDGFLAEPIKEDVPEWVMVTKKDEFNDVWWNDNINYLVEVVEYKTDITKESYVVNYKGEKDYYIQPEYCRPATTAEIEAHKLGFHIGDEVFLKESNDKRIILRFEIEKNWPIKSEQLRACFTNGNWASIIHITKQQPLMLGDCEVVIGEQLIACNDGSVTKKEWLKCMNIFIPIISKTEANEINIDIGGDYEAVFKLLNSGEILTNGPNYSIKLGCIPRVTIEQIQAITDKLNEV